MHVYYVQGNKNHDFRLWHAIKNGTVKILWWKKCNNSYQKINKWVYHHVQYIFKKNWKILQNNSKLKLR